MKIHVPIILYLHTNQKYGSDEYQYSIHVCDMSQYGFSFTGVKKEVTIEFDLPDEFDPRLAEVESLKREKTKILAESQMKANQIEERIQSLLCLECKP